ncbi:bifunctional 3-phenylpropionate/cinnamic acid dioxygenase ferredoxin subunit [Kineococcus rhizosphaerae]|uniref:3-phenylpropionate/trans-cinnamate dioxygenase ferredoxin subunit n=1 Tax=Kineococcus rhizosphaerae TaxID=559628 RepID=A0A2T0R695_9ACTN|nr:bifunctional 3-phenylpropionate/cinnamic acid dioxygenase ferredoxin subunit [Kineococcus rhizosphaerae]PRY16704.1 3-phenylpropionate/trans-cinnamate dioxygenase ferredoxin subunit [Kineococcus rhizosphaerae]
MSTGHRVVVCPAAALPAGEVVRVDRPGLDVPVAVFNVDGDLFAIDDTCTHADESLAEGWVEDCAVECPRHASAFDLRTGVPSSPPAITPVRTHLVEVVDGEVVVEVGTPRPA